MFGGSIVRMRTAAEAARAPGAGPSATDTLHVVVRSTMEGNGIPTVVPVAPDGVAFQRGLVNGLITGIARQVMSELDADGVIMPGGPRLTSSGFEVAALVEKQGSDTGMRLVYLNALVPDSVLSLTEAGLAVLERIGMAGGIGFEPWTAKETAKRAVQAGDVAGIAACVALAPEGQMANIAMAAMGLTAPMAGADVGTVAQLAAFTAGAAGVPVLPGRLERLLAVACSTPVGGRGACYDAEACKAALAMLAHVAAFLGGCVNSGVAMVVATEMAPRVGVATLPVAMRAPLVGAKAREVAKAAEAGSPPQQQLKQAPML